MPISEDQAFLVARSTAYDRDGTEIGPVIDIYYDNHTGQPEWVTITVTAQTPGGTGAGTGSRADDSRDPVHLTSARFAPLASASYSRGRLHVDVTVEQVHQAPPAAAAEHLDSATENRLYRHYGLSPAGDTNVDPRTGTTPRTQDEPGQHSLLPPAER